MFFRVIQVTELPRVIALYGKKRSGKDTVADIFCQVYGYKKIKIAELLKLMMKLLFDFDDDQLENHKKEIIDIRWGITPRNAMQFVGTEMMQYKLSELLPDTNRNFFINNLCRKYLDPKSNDKFVISDLRFRHEYEILKNKYNTHIIKIIRPIISDCQDHHTSECDMETFHIDKTIMNDGDLDALKNLIKNYHF